MFNADESTLTRLGEGGLISRGGADLMQVDEWPCLPRGIHCFNAFHTIPPMLLHWAPLRREHTVAVPEQFGDRLDQIGDLRAERVN